jgi:beta-xylosidase
MVTRKKNILNFSLLLFVIFSAAKITFAQTYTNPILHQDYSDPDAIRVGDHYYMIASSFTSIPGLPILRSTDLVHWKLMGYALKNNIPLDHYKKVQHGAGVWAPSIRFHHGEFYIYYPDPDFGIYMIKTKNILGNWSEPKLVLAGKGLIDPCPLWDDDGKVYLVHAYAGSRAGIKSVLAMKEMNASGTAIINDGQLIYDGHGIDPTVEGPKLYKRNGWYYVFAPAGGVATGWQIVLKSKHIYGPYERKVVLEQGASSINGPHQGAWLQTNTGQDWFMHFQDKGAYGRITHLQPMVWKNDWPYIGVDKNGNGIGEPVHSYALPKVQKSPASTFSKEVSDFQWQANPSPNWLIKFNNQYRHYAVLLKDSSVNLWNFPALYLQKIPADTFTTTTKIHFNSLQKGERAGFILMGKSYAALELVHSKDGLELNYITCKDADKKQAEQSIKVLDNAPSSIYLRLKMETGAVASYSYSIDGIHYENIGSKFTAFPGIWVGAKMGFYCISNAITNDAGYLEVHSLNTKK